MNRPTILQHTELSNLPKSVRDYLMATGVIGVQKIETVFLRQKGRFNINNKKWTPISAKQTVNINNPSFVWKAKSGPFEVIDQYVNGVGSLSIKLFGIIRLKKFQGKEVDQGELSRFLAEMIWYPTDFAESYLLWHELGEKAARATIIIDKNIQSAIQFNFNNEYLINSITGKRYREQNGSFSFENWMITGLEYQEFNGIKIPYKAQVGWEIDGLIMPYYQLEITEIKFNVASANLSAL